MLREEGYEPVGLDTDDVLEAFQVLYQSGGCIEAFHQYRETKSLVIGPWSDAGTRKVDYELSIKAPAFVTNIVGSELSVSEAQTVTWSDVHGNKMPDPFQADITPTVASSSSSESALESPAAYTIASVPTIQSTGSDRFVTELSFLFTKALAENKVTVTCSLQVEAKIWGLQSTLEPYMLSEAKKQLAEFVPFLTAYFTDHSGAPMLSKLPAPGSDVNAASSPKAAPSAPVSPEAEPSITAGPVDAMSQASRSSSEHFYDALEEVPKGVRAAVQIFEAVKEEASPRTALPGRLSAKSPNARSRASTSPVAQPISPSLKPHPGSPLQHPPAVSTAAPVTPPELAADSAASTPAPVVAQLQDVNAKLQLECASLRLDAAERRFRSLADATDACLRQLSAAAAAPAEPVAASWGSGAGVGFFVGAVFGFGAAAALSWGGTRAAARR